MFSKIGDSLSKMFKREENLRKNKKEELKMTTSLDFSHEGPHLLLFKLGAYIINDICPKRNESSRSKTLALTDADYTFIKEKHNLDR